MRSAVFISSGIGNALLLIPLMKELKKLGKVTIIGTSPSKVHKVFEGFDSDLIDEIIELDTNFDWLKHSASFGKKYDVSYLDFFSATRKNLMLAHIVSKRVVTNHIPPKLASVFKRKVEKIKPIVGIHEATQYVRFLNPNFSDEDLNESMFLLKAKNSAFQDDKSSYITIQPGSGNNQTPYKTWPLQRWAEVMEWLLSNTDKTIIVLGDQSEIEMIENLPQNDRVINLIDQTSLEDLPGILDNALLHLGQDSGLLHLAGCVGTPTVSIWGGSDPNIAGWKKVDSKKHKEVKIKMSCQPCYRWIAPNTNRTENPILCPDFACLNNIETKHVISVIEAQLNIA